jgi:hypothetical protein
MQYVPVHLLIILFAATTALAGLRSLTARQGTAKAYLRVVGDKHPCIPCSGYDR